MVPWFSEDEVRHAGKAFRQWQVEASVVFVGTLYCVSRCHEAKTNILQF